MRILAAITTGAGLPFEIVAADLDEPRDDEILVRIVGVGVCHTDIVVNEWGAIPPPAVLGHEGSGVVEKVGANVRKVVPGDHVVITFRSCGRCPCCARREPAYCHTMQALNSSGARPDGSSTISIDGRPVGSNFFGQSSFASKALAYESNVVKVPHDLPLALMGPLGCGVQTGVGGITRSLACRPGSSLLILGGGAVGLSAVMGAQLQRCGTVIVVEPHLARRDLALQLGATHALAPRAKEDLVAAVKAILPLGVDYAFDASGVPEMQQAAMAILAPRGVLGIVGISPHGTPLPGEVNAVMASGLTVKGIIEGDSDPDVFLPALMEHHRAGRLPFGRLITTFPFSEINEAIEAQQKGECVKIVLLMWESSAAGQP